MSDNARWVLPAGSSATDVWDVAVTGDLPGWSHTGLYAATLARDDTVQLAAGECEYVVVPLAGSVSVDATGPDGVRHRATLAGRASVFSGPTDVAYVPAGHEMTLTGAGPATRVAVAGAVAGRSGDPKPFRHLTAADVPVEVRGSGRATREVRNFAIPGVLDADSLIACEVITPAGNWSSYPPHKHDVERSGAETELEEIYYVELQREDPAREGSAPTAEDAMAYLRVYGTSERPIDVLAEVRTGDVVLVPHGWHGPAMAPPGYDLYYLNVMAGPGAERAWLICDDPAHGWVRDTWPAQAPDPRVPMRGRT